MSLNHDYTDVFGEDTEVEMRASKCEGYKCSICGMVYERGAYGFMEDVATNYPPEEIVAAHVKECIAKYAADNQKI